MNTGGRELESEKEEGDPAQTLGYFEKTIVQNCILINSTTQKKKVKKLSKIRGLANVIFEKVRNCFVFLLVASDSMLLLNYKRNGF